MKVSLRIAEQSDLEKIKPYIKKFFLDDEDLSPQQFFIAEVEQKLAGFGRIKNYEEVYELATLGVLENFRGCGIGKKIVQKLIQQFSSKEIWLTTLIPEFFQQFGFEENDNIPDEILLKCQRVCGKFNKTTRYSHYMRLYKL